METLKSKSMKRLAALVAGVALPILNRKLGLELTPDEVVASVTLIGGYILQSVVNDMSARNAGVKAAAEVKTPSDAIAIMKQLGDEGREVSK